MACIRKRRGKWVVDYRDSAGIRRWLTCETKRDAEDELDKKRRESRQGTHPVVDPNITIQAYSERWLLLIKATVKAATYFSYSNMLRLHVLPSFGATKVRQVHRGRIKEWLTTALNDNYARDSVRLMHGTLRGLLNAAIDDGILMANPADKLGRLLKLHIASTKRQEEIKAMTREQLATFLAASHALPESLSVLFLTLARTGMRIGEGLALQWHDVNFASRDIRVERGFSRGRLETPKSGIARTVDMSQQLSKALMRLHIRRKEETLKRRWLSMPPWVFCTQLGTPVDIGFAQRAFKKTVKSAKLPEHYSPHCLRHTYASLLLQMGVSPVYIQRQLGHASITMTVDTYGKWLPVGDKAAVDRLDGVIGSKTVAVGAGNQRNSLDDSQLERAASLIN